MQREPELPEPDLLRMITEVESENVEIGLTESI